MLSVKRGKAMSVNNVYQSDKCRDSIQIRQNSNNYNGVWEH